MKQSLFRLILRSFLIITPYTVAGDYAELKRKCEEILEKEVEKTDFTDHSDLCEAKIRLLDAIDSRVSETPTRNNVQSVYLEADQLYFEALSLLMQNPTNLAIKRISLSAHKLCVMLSDFAPHIHFGRTSTVLDNIIHTAQNIANMTEDCIKTTRQRLQILRDLLFSTTNSNDEMHFKATLVRIFVQSKVNAAVTRGAVVDKFYKTGLEDSIKQQKRALGMVADEFYTKPVLKDETKAQLDSLFEKVKREDWRPLQPNDERLIKSLVEQAALYAHYLGTDAISSFIDLCSLIRSDGEEERKIAIRDLLDAHKFCALIFNLLYQEPMKKRTSILMRELDKTDKTMEDNIARIIHAWLPRFKPDYDQSNENFHLISSIVYHIMKQNPDGQFSKKFLLPKICDLVQSNFQDGFKDFFLEDPKISLSYEELQTPQKDESSRALEIIRAIQPCYCADTQYKFLRALVKREYKSEPDEFNRLRTTEIDSELDFRQEWAHEHRAISYLTSAAARQTKPFIFDIENVINEVFKRIPREDRQLALDATFIIQIMLIRALVFVTSPGKDFQGRYALHISQEEIVKFLIDREPKFAKYFPMPMPNPQYADPEPNYDAYHAGYYAQDEYPQMPDPDAESEEYVEQVEYQQHIPFNPLACHLDMLELLSGQQKNLQQLLSMVAFLGIQPPYVTEDYLQYIIQQHALYIFALPIPYNPEESDAFMSSIQLSKNIAPEKFRSILEILVDSGAVVLPNQIDLLSEEEIKFLVKQNISTLPLDLDNLMIFADLLLEQISTKTATQYIIPMINYLLEWISSIHNNADSNNRIKLNKAKTVLETARTIYETQAELQRVNFNPNSNVQEKINILKRLLALPEMIRNAQKSSRRVVNLRKNASIQTSASSSSDAPVIQSQDLPLDLEMGVDLGIIPDNIDEYK